MQCIAVTLVAAAVSGIAQNALAEEAHEHGVGRLNVVVEGDSLHLELISPGANIVGFEHRPSSAEDRSAVAAAVTRLENGGSLFDLPAGAGCQLAHAEVETDMLEEAQASHDGEEHHEDQEEHSGHEDGEHGERHEATHSEFHAEYRFSCADTDALDRVRVGVFEHFPATEELEVQVISPRGQTAHELTASNPAIEL